jgi:hypothetical protein
MARVVLIISNYFIFNDQESVWASRTMYHVVEAIKNYRLLYLKLEQKLKEYYLIGVLSNICFPEHCI